jgi:hypothetical protein
MSTTNLFIESQTASRKSFFSSSSFAWLLLVAYLVLVKTVVLPLFPPIAIGPVAAIFNWQVILIFSLLGLAGVWLADRTGFRPALDPRVSNRQRYVVPLLVGAGIGALASLIDMATHGTEFIAAIMGVPSFNTDFPLSLFVYTSGTVIVEALYRLFPLPVLLWLISYVALKKRWQEGTFWALALLLSFFEPLGQLSGQMAQMTPQMMENFGQIFVTMFLPMLLTNYPMGVAQAYAFRRYGFLASFTLRMGFYIIWHIVYGSLIFPLLSG